MVIIRVITAQDAATALAGLSSARTPWLTLALAGPADHGRLAATAADPDVTVVDITDPQAVPVTVSPFEPAPGYPVQAHADRLAGLFEVVFGLGEPVTGGTAGGTAASLRGLRLGHAHRRGHAARIMGTAGHGGQPGWLEVVLSWPGRLIGR